MSIFQTPHPSQTSTTLQSIPEFKVILVGNSGVGKTCIVVRGSKGVFQEQNPTIGFAFQKLHKEIDSQQINLFVWDTAGGAQSAIVVYDITSKVSTLFCLSYLEESFEGAKKWVLDLKRNEFLSESDFILIGNKKDLEEDRQVSQQEGEEYAQQQSMMFAEVSAKNGENINQTFDMIGRSLLKRYEKQIKRQKDYNSMKRNIVIGDNNQNDDSKYCMGNCGIF